MKKYISQFYKKTSNQIVLAVFVGIVLLSAYFVLNDYRNYMHRSEEQMLSRLEAIASTLSLSIPGNLHEQVCKIYPKKDAIRQSDQDSSYFKLYQILQQAHQANLLTSPINTIAFDSLSNEFQIICTSADLPHFRQRYPDSSRKLIEKYTEGKKLSKYHTDNGTWLSVFKPVKNKAGKTVALVQIDQEFSYFLNNAKRELLKNILLSMFVFGVISFGLSHYIYSVLKREEAFKQVLMDQNEEIRTQNEEIKSQNEEIESQSSLIQRSNNKLEYAQIIIEKQNIQLRRHNEELDRKVKSRTLELQQANLDLSTFLYRSSHDIQGPLATLKGLCRLADLEIKDETAATYFKKVSSTTQSLEHFIKSITSVYEIKSAEMNIQNIPIRSLVENIIHKSKFITPDDQIDFVVDIDPALTIQTDLAMLDSILTALVQNAIYFRTHEAGQHPFVKIAGFASEQQELIMAVSDNGIGIKADTEERIFDMFHRGSVLSKGAGLGLYIVRTALSKLDGKIALLKSAQPGTTFQVTIPATISPKNESTYQNR